MAVTVKKVMLWRSEVGPWGPASSMDAWTETTSSRTDRACGSVESSRGGDVIRPDAGRSSQSSRADHKNASG
jgi:hypothetical protein